LIVYLYRSGFARFCHHPYNIDDLNDEVAHFTNVAINKNADNYNEKVIYQNYNIYNIAWRKMVS